MMHDAEHLVIPLQRGHPSNDTSGGKGQMRHLLAMPSPNMAAQESQLRRWRWDDTVIIKAGL